MAGLPRMRLWSQFHLGPLVGALGTIVHRDPLRWGLMGAAALVVAAVGLPLVWQTDGLAAGAASLAVAWTLVGGTRPRARTFWALARPGGRAMGRWWTGARIALGLGTGIVLMLVVPRAGLWSAGGWLIGLALGFAGRLDVGRGSRLPGRGVLAWGWSMARWFVVPWGLALAAFGGIAASGRVPGWVHDLTVPAAVLMGWLGVSAAAPREFWRVSRAPLGRRLTGWALPFGVLAGGAALAMGFVSVEAGLLTACGLWMGFWWGLARPGNLLDGAWGLAWLVVSANLVAVGAAWVVGGLELAVGAVAALRWVEEERDHG